MKKDGSTSAKRGKNGKIAAVIVVLCIIAACGAAASALSGAPTSVVQAETLERTDMSNTVSASGIVESRTFRSVSSPVSGYPVDTVCVEVGDRVQMGDVLCTLDTQSLQSEILQQQSILDNANISTEYQISDAEKAYNDAYTQINDGTYPGIYSAKTALTSAQNALERAQSRYEEQLSLAGSDKDSQLITAQNSLKSAQAELDYAYEDMIKAEDEMNSGESIKTLKKAYEDAKKEYDSRYSSIKHETLEKARSAYENAVSTYKYVYAGYTEGSVTSLELQNAEDKVTAAKAELDSLTAKYDVDSTEDTYEDALDAYTDAQTSLRKQYEAAQRSYERAKTAYELAQSSLEAVKSGNEISLNGYKEAVDDAQLAVDEALESYDLAVKNAELNLAQLKTAADKEKLLSNNDSQVIALELLKDKLAKAVVTAPCDGTVTAVYTSEGAYTEGVLFIIEDTDNLKLTVSVKEYLVGELNEGAEVTVKCSALDDREFEGVISKIAPTAVKGADGKSSGTAEYEAEVIIRGTKDSGLLIGMNAKLTAVTESVENVLAVSYDCVGEDEDGSEYVYEAVKNDDDTYTAKKIYVETGFESDAKVEITSDELYDGMLILQSADELTEGQLVSLLDFDTGSAGDETEDSAE